MAGMRKANGEGLPKSKDCGRIIERLGHWKGEGFTMCRDRQWLATACMALLCMVLLCGTAMALKDGIVWPEASGEVTNSSDKLTIDLSHAELGYVMVHGPSTNKRLKLRVEKKGTQGYLDYDLNGEENWEIIPLQLGDGDYKFSLYVQASGNKYATGGQLTVTAQLADPNGAFLIPSQYVYYEPDTPAIAKSDELCADLTTDQEKFEAIRAYINENYEYDFNKAKTVTSGTLPSVDYIWETGMGICQDLSALAACMLRVQGIPTRLDIGYVGGKYYHAWNSVILDGELVQYDATLELNAIPQGYSYSLERFY